MSQAPSFENLRRAAFHRFPDASRADGSDIVLHLPVLEWFAGQCQHVTEFGVRGGESTVALIGSGCPEVRSFDLERTPIVDALERLRLPANWVFGQLDTGSDIDAPRIGETDLLFLDTLHTFGHVSRELSLHGRKARRFLAVHDITAFPEVDGAVVNFMGKHRGEYRTAYETHWNNGFLVLERLP